MPSAKEIESTEKLLRLIRKDEPAQQSKTVLTQAAPSLPPPGSAPGRKASLTPFSGGKGTSLAVDIEPAALRVALAVTRRGRTTFQQLRAFPYPAGLTPDLPHFPAFLSSCVKQTTGGVKTDVWTFVPMDMVEFATLKIPDVPAKDIPNMVVWAVKKEKKFNEKTHLFEYRVLDRVTDKGVTKRLVAYFLTPLTEIQRLKNLFRQAGLSLTGISFEPMAIQNYVMAGWIQEPSSVFAHVHSCRSGSRIDIFHHSNLVFSRTIRTGTLSFVEAIHDELDIAPDAALDPAGLEPPGTRTEAGAPDVEALFLAYIHANRADPASSAPHLSAEQIMEMITPALERGVRQVERTLDYSVNQLGFPPVERILLSGVPALFPGLKDSIASQLSVPVELIDPLSAEPGLSSGNTATDGVSRMEFLHVAGLALSSRERTMNALHTHVQRSREKTRARLNMAAGFLVLLLLGAVYAGHASVSSRLDGLRTQIQFQETRLQQLAAFPGTQEMAALFAEARDRDAKVKDYVNRYRPMAAMSALTGATPVWAGLRDVAFRFPENKAEPGQVGEGEIKGQVAAPLETLDAYLSSYILTLGESPAFASPRLVSKNQVSRGEGETVLEFNISLKLR